MIGDKEPDGIHTTDALEDAQDSAWTQYVDDEAIALAKMMGGPHGLLKVSCALRRAFAAGYAAGRGAA